MKKCLLLPLKLFEKYDYHLSSNNLKTKKFLLNIQNKQTNNRLIKILVSVYMKLCRKKNNFKQKSLKKNIIKNHGMTNTTLRIIIVFSTKIYSRIIIEVSFEYYYLLSST